MGKALKPKEKRKITQIANKLIKKYLTHSPPRIRWKELGEDTFGLADREKNAVYLNPSPSGNVMGSMIGSGTFYEIKIKLKLNQKEKYFVTLIHEIGHFKIRKKPPKEWIKTKKVLMKKVEEEDEIGRKFGQEPMTHQAKLDYIGYRVCDVLKRRKNEEDKRYYFRVNDFKKWLSTGASMTEHKTVHNWAIKEFKKQRTWIRNRLKEG